MTKKQTKDKKKFIVIKENRILMDRTHVIGCGGIDILQEGVLGDYYIPMSFSFHYLKRAEDFFKSIHGDLYKEDYVRCMIPSKKEAPVIFVYDNTEQKHVFCIAPRTESGFEVFNEKGSQFHDSVKRES